MSGITSHILDLTHGQPASDVTIDLYFSESLESRGNWKWLITANTNSDGRLDQPLLSGKEMKRGHYELIVHIGDYFRSKALDLPDPSFLEQVPIRFGVANPFGHYHVPLLISPWGYQVYRGS